MPDVFSDGSGGEFSSVPSLRRAGWSWVYLSADCESLLLARYSGVPGERQTVPRAELTAIIAITERARQPHITIVVDAAYIIKGVRAGERECRSIANADLWDRFWDRFWEVVWEGVWRGVWEGVWEEVWRRPWKTVVITNRSERP